MSQMWGTGQMPSRAAEIKTLRALALFEGAKSVLILLLGFGLLSLMHRNIPGLAHSLIETLHLNPTRTYTRIFLRAAEQISNGSLWMFAGVALADAATRGVLAYGLWFDLYWAKWLGVISAAVYLPVELYEIYHHVTLLKILALAINLAIVAYLAWAIQFERQQRTQRR